MATAIYDGADAIMLSAESAAGKYPVEAVMMQQRVINRVEEVRKGGKLPTVGMKQGKRVKVGWLNRPALPDA